MEREVPVSENFSLQSTLSSSVEVGVHALIMQGVLYHSLHSYLFPFFLVLMLVFSHSHSVTLERLH